MEAGEQRLLDAVAGMLADRGYLLPLAAAQRQFRDAYYGMSAAALLEDLFVDALTSYLHQNRPDVQLERPPRGQRGWDYSLDGTQASHKVGQGPTEIAALWDATRVGVATWSFDSTVLFTSSEYAPKQVDLTVGAHPVRLRPLSGRADEPVKRGHGLLAVRWPRTGPATLLGLWHAQADSTVTQLVPFTVLWQQVSRALAAGAAANEVEVLHVPARDLPTLKPPSGQQPDDAPLFDVPPPALRIAAHDLRPGVYLLAKDLLQNVPVRANNRALLVARATVAQLMRQAVTAGLYAPLPTWFAAWAPVRPPNLYLTQRAQYEQMFSGL